MNRIAKGLFAAALGVTIFVISAPSFAPNLIRAPVSGRPRIAFGTPHPTVVEAYSPDGRWIVACQARRDTDRKKGIRVFSGFHGDLSGDEMKPYFFREGKPGELIDAFVDADSSGRWVALIQGGSLILRDTRSEHDQRLGPPVAQENPSMFPRAATFSDDGKLFLYILEPSERAVLRNLDTGEERVIDHGSGRLWQARFAGGGAFLALAIVTRDTNSNGRLDLPSLQTSLSGHRCRGTVLSYSSFGYSGDKFAWKVRTLDGVVVAGEFVSSAENVVITSIDEQNLRWNFPNGRSVAAVTEPCASGYEVAAVWPPTRGVLAHCEATSSNAIHDREGKHDLELSGKLWTSINVPTQRIIVSDSDLIDMETRRTHKRNYEGELAIRGTRVFEETSKRSIRVRDLADGSLRFIDVPKSVTDSYSRSWGRWMAVKRHEDRDVLIVDIEDERFAGVVPSMPILITEEGDVAYLEESEKQMDGIPSGPVVWTAVERRASPARR